MLALGSLIILGLVGCTKRGAEEEEQGGVAPRVAVQAVPIVLGNVVQTVTATGRTDVLRRQKILSPVAGTIATLNVLEGSSVQSHEILATIVTKESQSAIAGAEALLRLAGTPEQKADAQRALQLAKDAENTVNVTAPFSGVVASRVANAGELVSENSEMCSIVDLTSIVFLVEVPLRDIDRVRNGMNARVYFPAIGSSSIEAVVDAILPRADLQSQTNVVRLRMKGNGNSLRLRPDMGGMADIGIGIHKNAMLVPRSALLRDDEKNTASIMIVTPDSLALSVVVETGATTDSTIEVVSTALHSGMLVITEGHYGIADSTRVTMNGRDSR